MGPSLTCVTDLLLHCGTLGDRHQLALLRTTLRNEKKIKIKTSIQKHKDNYQNFLLQTENL